MSNLPIHRPPEWELFRNESIVSQNVKKAERVARAAALESKSGCRNHGLWWPQQRFVDQVAPAEMVNPDDFDTMNYRYQVYARPPPVKCELCPVDLSQVTDKPPPVRYNVKRVAVDKQCSESTWQGRSTGRNWCSHNNTQATGAGRGTRQGGHQYLNTSNNALDVDDDVSFQIQTSGEALFYGEDSCHRLDSDSNNNHNADESWSNNATCGSSGCSRERSPSVNSSEKQDKFKIGYGTYKIIGGRQYHQPHPSLPDDYNMALPPAQEEYRAFIRRCPNYKLGRYDRHHVHNEMLLTATRAATLMPTSLSPFQFTKNPRAGKSVPLFAPTTPEDLEWPVSNRTPACYRSQ